MTSQVVLLGDSILDNQTYVPGEPDVVTQLRGRLPEGWDATLGAIDGSVITDVPGQLRGLPRDARLLVVSVGGNDALHEMGLLEAPAGSVGAALLTVAGVAADFERRYGEMLRAVIGTGVPAAVCTIYYPRFPDPLLQRSTVAALSHFNDVIVRLAFANRLPIIDLRLVCDADGDYANEIEPSARGGSKIAAAIAALLSDDEKWRHTGVVAG